MPYKGQFVFQGGGARLGSLLPYAVALKKLSDDDDFIDVTRVAGTSAGAIVATAYSAGDPESVVDRILSPEFRDSYVEKLNVPRVKALWRILRKKPVVDKVLLEKAIEFLFGENRVLGNLSPETFICATDLENHCRVIYRSGDNDQKKHFLRYVLRDTALIPFYFSANCRIVDGGIVDNFPIQSFIREEDEYGPTIGVCLNKRRGPGHDRSILGFGGALLGAAMDSSTEDSKDQLGRRRTIGIDTDYSTFDFDDGIDRLRSAKDDGFENEVAQLEKVIRKAQGAQTVQVSLQRAYDGYLGRAKFRYRLVVFEAVASSLASEAEDVFKFTTIVEPTVEPVLSHKFVLTTDGGDPLKSESRIEVHKWVHEKWEEAEFVSVPLNRLDTTSGLVSEEIVFFDPPLQPGACYRIVCEDIVYDEFRDAREKKVTPHYVDKHDRADQVDARYIVIHTPNSVKPSFSGLPSVEDYNSVDKIEYSLTDGGDLYELPLTAPTGYSTVISREQVPSTKVFGLDVTVKSRR